MKIVSTQYPQIKSSVLKTPLNFVAGVTNSYPNNVPYAINPLGSIPYQLGENNLYNIPNTCDMQGF
jgi:hypothetical protein